ncbi:hypothetical protein HUW63_07610 [Myxococcus sp. AM001]|nr:hypothetical protein [Myxococcus sp. AM001]
MKRQAMNASFVLLALVAMPAFAGKHHYGNGPTRESACAAAERRAAKAAADKGTCYDSCNVNTCKKLDDGTFTCEAISANHPGSCRR